MMYAFNFDATNTAHMSALGAIISLAATNGVPFEVITNGTSTTASATPSVSAPVKSEPKERKPVTDGTLPITVRKSPKGVYAFNLGYGEGREGAKLMVKDAGFKWDASYADDHFKGAFVGTTAQAKALGLTAKSTEIAYTAEWQQKGRDKAAAKAERKNR